MKVKHLFPTLLVLFYSSVFFIACGDGVKVSDEPNPGGKYTHGVFVVNEGPFNGSGSISWHNPATGETVEDVFARENGGALLGQFVQSLAFHNGLAYIVVNSANRVYVVDAETFVFVDSIGGLALPRYFLPLDDRFALISQWGADGLSGSVAKVDLSTNEILKTIPLGAGAEKMLRLDQNTVLVANSGGFGVDSTVSVLNLVSETETARYKLPGKNPGGFAKGSFDAAQQPYALCKASFLDASPKGWVGPNKGGGGFVTVPYADDLTASPNGDQLYFAGGNAVYKVDAGGVSKLFDQAVYGLYCDPATGYLYCGDAKDFSAAGQVVVRKPNGETLFSFPVGVAPGEIVVLQ